MSSRHFCNFIAIFNGAVVAKKKSFVFPLRKIRVLRLLDYLTEIGLIHGYNAEELERRRQNLHLRNIPLGKKGGPYYVPVTVFLKDGNPIRYIKTASKPGRCWGVPAHQMRHYLKNHGPHAHLVFSSDELRGFCSAEKLYARGLGGLYICAVHLNSNGGSLFT